MIEVMCSDSNYVMWNEYQKGRKKAFVGYIQIRTDKTATKLKTSGLIVYPVHGVLLKILSRLEDH